MKLKLSASCSKTDNKLRLKATLRVKASDHDSISDAIGVWMDNNLVEGFPEGAELDSWMVGSIDPITGTAWGPMSCMLSDGSGLDGEFTAYITGSVCTKVVFSTPAYED